MKTRQILVKSSIPGIEPRMADINVCDCGCENWIVFQIVGQNHPHLECVACGENYCVVKGSCELEESE